MGSCLGVGTNFNPRLRTSSSVGDSWASERLTTVLIIKSHFYLGKEMPAGLGFIVQAISGYDGVPEFTACRGTVCTVE